MTKQQCEKLTELLEKGRKPPFYQGLLSIDPGHTTGVAFWAGCELMSTWQIPTKDLTKPLPEFTSIIDATTPNVVVMEEYRVYANKAENHAHSTLHTAQVIGAIRYMCALRGIPVFFQGAGQVKQFCSDKFLQKFDLYQKGSPHARDAVRHGLYYILFTRQRKNTELGRSKEDDSSTRRVSRPLG